MKGGHDLATLDGWVMMHAEDGVGSNSTIPSYVRQLLRVAKAARGLRRAARVGLGAELHRALDRLDELERKWAERYGRDEAKAKAVELLK